MTLPQRVQIGPYVYRVSQDGAECNAAQVADSSQFWARIQHTTNTILVNPDQQPSRKRAMLLHEVLHGVLDLSDTRDRKEMTEEDLVQALAAPLLDTLRRNLDLVAYLTAEAS